jgi:hypothetical protein
MIVTSLCFKASGRSGKKRWSNNLKTLMRVAVILFVLGVRTASGLPVSALPVSIKNQVRNRYVYVPRLTV